MLRLVWLLTATSLITGLSILMLSRIFPQRHVLGRFLRYVHLLFACGKLKNEAVLRKVKHTANPLVPVGDVAVGLTSIPKRWLTHFYLVGTLTHSLLYLFLLSVLVGVRPPASMVAFFRSTTRAPLDTNGQKLGWPLLLVFTMEQLHLSRRLYECLYVSIFSKTTMSIVHYLYGMLLTTTFGLGLLAEVDLETIGFGVPSNVQLIGVVIFVLGSYLQHRSLRILAHLRKRRKHHAGYYVPHGHLFEWVSSPHYLGEVMVYASYALVWGGQSSYLNNLAHFVFAVQATGAYLAHKWYEDRFPEYRNLFRTAMIPVVW